MASEGTEPASQRKLREARERGWVPRSGVLAPACAWLALSALLAGWGKQGFASLQQWLVAWLEGSAPAEAPRLALEALRATLSGLALWLVAAWAFVLLVDYLQVGAVWARRAEPGPVRPRLPGWLSAALLSAVALSALAWAFDAALSVAWLEPGAPGDRLPVVLERFALTFALGLSLVAAVDVVRSRAHHFASLRMTRGEQRRERREAEGPDEPRREQRRRFRTPHRGAS